MGGKGIVSEPGTLMGDGLIKRTLMPFGVKKRPRKIEGRSVKDFR